MASFAKYVYNVFAGLTELKSKTIYGNSIRNNLIKLLQNLRFENILNLIKNFILAYAPSAGDMAMLSLIGIAIVLALLLAVYDFCVNMYDKFKAYREKRKEEDKKSKKK